MICGHVRLGAKDCIACIVRFNVVWGNETVMSELGLQRHVRPEFVWGGIGGLVELSVGRCLEDNFWRTKRKENGCFEREWKLDGDRYQVFSSWDKRDWMAHVLRSKAGVGWWCMGGNVVEACGTC